MTDRQQGGDGEAQQCTDDYCRDVLDPDTTLKLQAGAFRSLCRHLQERSDAVSNMELMTISGFCRNCLAKVRPVQTNFFLLLDDDDDTSSLNNLAPRAGI